MSHLRHDLGRAFFLIAFATLLLFAQTPVTLAQNDSETILKPVVSPRRSPPPIPHTSVIAGGSAPALNPMTAMNAQGTAGQPGVLQTATSISSGLTLFEPSNVCSDFDQGGRWQGETWTQYFAGWGTYAADGGIYQAKNVTFDRELVVGPGDNYGKGNFSIKIASNQPYQAGIMSPPIWTNKGDVVLVRAAYLIYNHDTAGRNWDYVAMGIIPKIGEQASYALGHQRGVWAIIEHEIVATGRNIVVMLQAQSPDALNSNIYFDNVQIFVNGVARSNCRG